MRPTPRLALTLGDPAGVGPAMSLKAWQMRHEMPDLHFYVRGDPDCFPASSVRVIATPSDAATVFSSALPLIPLSNRATGVQPGRPNKDTVAAILESIESCVDDVRNGVADGIVTNPISKALMAEDGFSFPGHTEFLAHLCEQNPDDSPPVMMLIGGGLKVALATIHLPLRRAIDAISQPLLIQTGQIVDKAMRRDFGVQSPRLVFTGLNPHAGEAGLLGHEEQRIVNPAAETLRSLGVDMSDARPADSVYAEALSGAYDAVIAMTHDQGLIPVKTLDLWGGVNTTLGLSIIRTSPDHGTAYDAAAAGTVRADSLIAALKCAADMARSRTSTRALP